MRYNNSLGGEGSYRGYTYDSLVRLITVDETSGDETNRESYAEIKTVTMSETYQALTVGLKPSIVAVLPSWLDDYAGEELVEVDGYRYRVLRSYRTEDDHAELTLTRLRKVPESGTDREAKP